MHNQSKGNCILDDIAGSETVDELLDVLHNAADIVGVERTREKGCYGCGRCAVTVTVEYPDIDSAVETAAIAPGRGAKQNCLSVKSPITLRVIKERFAATEALAD